MPWPGGPCTITQPGNPPSFEPPRLSRLPGLLPAAEVPGTYSNSRLGGSISYDRVEDAFRDLKARFPSAPSFTTSNTGSRLTSSSVCWPMTCSFRSKSFLDRGIHTSWATLRQQLSTHQVITVVLPTADGALLKIRNATKPEPQYRLIYDALGITPTTPCLPERSGYHPG